MRLKVMMSVSALSCSVFYQPHSPKCVKCCCYTRCESKQECSSKAKRMQLESGVQCGVTAHLAMLKGVLVCGSRLREDLETWLKYSTSRSHFKAVTIEEVSKIGHFRGCVYFMFSEIFRHQLCIRRLCPSLVEDEVVSEA